MNQCQLIGRLTNDPELRQTQSGISVATFTLAVERRFQRDQADFINIVAWRNTAEFCANYFRKGLRVGVSGSIQTRTYDAQDGTRRYITEVVADNVEFADGKRDNGAAPEYASVYTDPDLTPVEEDDLPF